MSSGKDGQTKKLARRRRGAEISLSTHYEEKLSQRMRAKGISRSEAVRQLIEESEARGNNGLEEIRGHCHVIKMASMQARRLAGMSCGELLDRIETAANRIAALAGG